MIATQRSHMPQHPMAMFTVWLAALQAAAWARLTDWRGQGVVPAIPFLENAERFERAGLPDPEAYTHALGTR